MNKLKNTDINDVLQRILIILMVLFFFIFLLMPILMMFGQIFTDDLGNYVGLDNFREYFSNPLLFSSIYHSLNISIITGVISTLLGLLYAYGLNRTYIKGTPAYRYAAMLPLFLPTMVHGMALVYLFGRTGLITNILGIDIGLYGKTGIIMAEVFYTFPQAYMVLSVALSTADKRLYEAAMAMDASPVRTFFKITLPSLRYGLTNSFIVCFTLSFTDFGAPEVVGGNYSVLATDIYRNVVGQQKMSMGAVVGLILTIPAFISFIIDLAMQKKNSRNELSSKSVAFSPFPSKVRDYLYQVICTIIALCISLLLLSVVLAAITTRWPYDLKLTLEHFNFSQKLLGSGVISFINSFKLSLGTALLGTILVFIFAYLIIKVDVMPHTRSFCKFMATMPMALPGLVLGLGYIMFFNKTWIKIPLLNIEIENSFSGLYGTFMIMIFCTITHLFSVTFVTAVTALSKLDREYETVAKSLNISNATVFCRVTVPMTITAILEVFVYFFVNSMVTVSAIVFIYTSQTKPAAIAILNMDDNGDYASAAAMSILILFINISIRIIYEILNSKLSAKSTGRKEV